MAFAFFFESVGGGEWLVLLAVVLIVVGPRNLPAAARKIGQIMSQIRRAADEFKRQLMSMDQEVQSAVAEVKQDYMDVGNEIGNEVNDAVADDGTSIPPGDDSSDYDSSDGASDYDEDRAMWESYGRDYDDPDRTDDYDDPNTSDSGPEMSDSGDEPSGEGAAEAAAEEPPKEGSAG